MEHPADFTNVYAFHTEIFHHNFRLVLCR